MQIRYEETIPIGYAMSRNGDLLDYMNTLYLFFSIYYNNIKFIIMQYTNNIFTKVNTLLSNIYKRFLLILLYENLILLQDSLYE